MKVLVDGNNLQIGGCQVNSIELSATLRDTYGFKVTFFATPGPLIELVREKRLNYFPAPDGPSLKRVFALREAVRSEKPDLVHAWHWWQWLDVFYAVHLPMRVPMLISHMDMVPFPIMPKSVLTTYGTPELRDLARAEGRRAELLMPPVDVHANAPEAVDPRPFREEFGLQQGDITMVIVSRLGCLLKAGEAASPRTMKCEGLFRTIEAVRQLGHDLPLRLLIVGEGEIRSSLQALADEVNSALGRRTVILTGQRVDPRPAYAAADIVIGMGGSALRGLAFAKPVIVVGEGAFSAAFTPETAEMFYYQGMFGRGDGGRDNGGLVADIRALAEHLERLPALGGFSRQFVVQHFSLEMLGSLLARYCETAVADVRPLRAAVADGLRSSAVSVRQRKLGGLPMGPALRKVLGRSRALCF